MVLGLQPNNREGAAFLLEGLAKEEQTPEHVWESFLIVPEPQNEDFPTSCRSWVWPVRCKLKGSVIAHGILPSKAGDMYLLSVLLCPCILSLGIWM